MATDEQVLEVARRELGTTEQPPGSNRTKYGQAYGSNGVYWCQIFCWWVMQQVPGGASLVPKSAYTPFVWNWFRDHERAGSTPRPGALVFFNWRDGSRAWPLPQHVGLVEAVHSDGSITCIEGNTQSGSSGDQSNGGGVFRRRRARSPYVVGYGYPAYSSSAAAPSSPASPPLPDLEDELMASIPLRLDAARTFHEAVGADVGGGSRVANLGFVTWGSTYGGTTWTVAALAEDGRVLAYWPNVRTSNNCATSRELPSGTRCVTVEGQSDNEGTRPWASTWPVRT